MQDEDGVKAVEDSADLVGVFDLQTSAIDVIEDSTETMREMGDLGMTAAHRTRRIIATQHLGQCRVELRVFRPFVRDQLVNQEPFHASRQLQSHVGGNDPDLIGNGQQVIEIGTEDQVLTTEPLYELEIAGVEDGDSMA